MYMNLRRMSIMTLLTVIVVFTNSCTKLAMLSSGATVAVSHNTYAKVYSGIDFLTIIKTEKDIRTHMYHNLKGNK